MSQPRRLPARSSNTTAQGVATAVAAAHAAMLPGSCSIARWNWQQPATPSRRGSPTGGRGWRRRRRARRRAPTTAKAYRTQPRSLGHFSQGVGLRVTYSICRFANAGVVGGRLWPPGFPLCFCEKYGNLARTDLKNEQISQSGCFQACYEIIRGVVGWSESRPEFQYK
jgi:hypothetical protein